MIRSDQTAPGERRFSFGRMVTNMFPPIIRRSELDSETLTPAEHDRLFDFQIDMQEPKKLTAATMYIMEIAPDERNARKVVEKLESIGVLKNGRQSVQTGDINHASSSSPASTSGSTVDTSMIGRNFANQIPMIPAWRQKRLVNLLFAWEEELMRWRLLEEEEREICVVMEEEVRAGAGERVGHLEKRLLEIQGLARLKPSWRERGGVATREDEAPPDYEERTDSSVPRVV